jgi:hypothetical protein
MIDVETLVDLAKEVEGKDQIDWSQLAIEKDTAYRLVATSVLEMESQMDKEAILATMTQLIVENMVLNIKLLQKNE